MATLDCIHSNLKRQEVAQQYFGLDFVITTDVCQDCGAVLRDEATERNFRNWLNQIAQSHRDKFTLQPFFSPNAVNCLENLLNNFPGAHISVLIRAMVSVYINNVLTDPERTQTVESIVDSEIFSSFVDDGTPMKRHSINFKPIALLDIVTWAEILEMAPAKFVQEATLRILALSYDSNPGLKSYWDQHIFPKLRMIINAA